MMYRIHRNVFVAAVATVMVVAIAVSLPVAGGRARAAGPLGAPVPQGIFDAGSSFYQAGICASDINGDGVQELLVGNQNGNLYCFRPDATVLWSYYTGSAIQSTPACSDVDGDGQEEIWVGDMSGRIWGFDSSGNPLSKWGWPKPTHSVGGISGIFSSPAIGDINGDGAAEIVVGSYGQRVYAWSYTGRMLPGWPYNNEDTVWSSPALADIDYDGVKEVVIGADSTGGVNWPYPPGGLLYVLDENGSVAPGFPKVTPEVTWSSPAVADINGDGRYEIVVGTGHYYTTQGTITTEGERVYAYDSQGNLLPGWPVSVAGDTFSSPAIGDIDGDGVKEIVIGTLQVNGIGSETVTVIKPDGHISLQVNGLGGPTFASPVLGDVNGDGRPDIILGSGQRFYAWDSTGAQLFNIDMANFCVGEPAVGDFDEDGRVEVAVISGDAPGGAFAGGTFRVYDCAAVTGADPFPWPMFRRTSDHHATVLTGNEPPPPPPASWTSWYVAEGSTGPGMETYVLVQNPGDDVANVRLTYMTQNGEVPGPTVAMAPHSRRTFFAADSVPDTWDVSTMVSSDSNVVVERSVYGNNRQWAHNSIGVIKPSSSWYLAEGSTGPGMETWVLVQNPNRTAVDVKLSFMTDKGPRAGPEVIMPAVSRRTFNLANYVNGYWGVSTRVLADQPVVAERSMYNSARTWATGSIGAPLPSTEWYLAEGSTGPGMETWILVQNPTYPEAHVHIDYMTPAGGRINGPTFTVPSSARKTIYAADTVNNAWSLSAVVTSDNPVIVERAMYGNSRTWADDSIGVTTPKKTWYLAEGSTGPGMETWLTVQNPGTESATVYLTYMTPNGTVGGPSTVMPPASRFTFFVADTVPNTWEVSAVVQSDKDIVVERAMYGNNRTWGQESIGFAP